MVQSKSKINPIPIVSGFLRTLVEDDGRRNLRDYVEQYVVAFIGGAVVVWQEVDLPGQVKAGALAISALFAAFLFQLTIQLLERSASWVDNAPEPGAETTQHAKLLEELSANSAYAALVSALVSSASLVSIVANTGWSGRIIGGLLVASFIHLSAAMLLVLRRVFLLTQERLNTARTGVGRHPVP